MKKLIPTLLIILLFASSNQLLAQGDPNASNSFEVTEIVSPIPNKNYQKNDSTDFKIRIRNLGPNSIYASDQFKITYSVYPANGINVQSYDTSIRVGETMPVNKLLEYTLNENIKLDTFNTYYDACAGVNGTAFYPVNSNKFPSKCSPFLVRLEKQKLELNKFYYAEQILHFELSTNQQLTAEIFDITGKSIKRIKLTNSKKQQIPFNTAVNGFYFMKVYNNSAVFTTVKFVVNQ